LERGVPNFPFALSLIGSDRAVGGHGILKSAPTFFGATDIHTSQVCAPPRRQVLCVNTWRTTMPMFILSLNWTEQGIRSVKDAPKRAKAAQELAKKVGIQIKEVYLTSGDDDLLIIVDTPNGDNVAKFALALGSQGNVRTRTARAWPQSEFQKLISELP
jgi:uncharacterized protein with GYD domain